MKKTIWLSFVFFLALACTGYAQDTDAKMSLSSEEVEDVATVEQTLAVETEEDSDDAEIVEQRETVPLIDLSKIDWHASVSAKAETISTSTLRAYDDWTTVSMPSLFDLNASQSICLVCLPFVENAPTDENAQQLITIGGLKGNCQVRLNGNLFERVREPVSLESKKDECLYTGRGVINGINIISISVESNATSKMHGVSALPLTLSCNRSAIDVPPYFNTMFTENTGTLNTTDVLDSIREFVERTTTTVNDTANLKRKPCSISRFEGYPNIELPTVSKLTPTNIRNPFSPTLSVMLDKITTVSRTEQLGQDTLGNLCTAWEVNGENQNRAVQYVLACAMTYPGGLVRIANGQFLPIRLEFPQGHGMLQILHKSQLKALFPNADVSDYSVILVAEGVAKSVPMLLVFHNANYNIIHDGQTVNLSVITNTGKDAFIYVIFPYGTGIKNLSSNPDDLVKTLAVLEPDQHPSDVLLNWLRMAFSFPIAQEDWFSLRSDEKSSTVSIYQLTQYRQFNDLSLRSSSPWFPPVVTDKEATLNNSLPMAEMTDILSSEGPVMIPVDDFISSSGLSIVAYELPVLDFGFDVPFAMEDRGNLLEKNSILDSNIIDNNPDLAEIMYHNIYPVMIGLPFVSDATRLACYEQINAYISAFLSAGIPTVELNARRCGMALYALTEWALYTGERVDINAHWDVIKKLIAHVISTDDWASLTSREPGADVSLQACMVAYLSYYKLSSMTNHDDDAALAALFLARNTRAVLSAINKTTLRLNTKTIADNPEPLPDLHDEIVSQLSFDNIVIPQIALLLEKNRPQQLHSLIAYLQGQRSLHQGEASLVLDWYGNALGFDPPEKIMSTYFYDPARKLMPNSQPLLISLIVKEIPARIVDWESAGYLKSNAVRIGRNWKLSAVFDNYDQKNKVTISMPSKPLSVKVNDKPVPLTNMEYKNGKLKIQLVKPGINEITVLI